VLAADVEVRRTASLEAGASEAARYEVGALEFWM
jgi:hypothetical protein